MSSATFSALPNTTLVLKIIRIAYCHPQERVPVLDRDGPLPRLQDLTKLSVGPGYPLHDIAEMTTGPFCVSERSSGRVGVIWIAVAIFNSDIQIPQFFICAEKTPEHDNSLNSEEFVRIGIVLLNPCKQSDQGVLCHLPTDFASRGGTNQFLSFIREGIQALLGWFNVA